MLLASHKGVKKQYRIQNTATHNRLISRGTSRTDGGASALISSRKTDAWISGAIFPTRAIFDVSQVGATSRTTDGALAFDAVDESFHAVGKAVRRYLGWKGKEEWCGGDGCHELHFWYFSQLFDDRNLWTKSEECGTDYWPLASIQSLARSLFKALAAVDEPAPYILPPAIIVSIKVPSLSHTFFFMSKSFEVTIWIPISKLMEITMTYSFRHTYQKKILHSTSSL